MNILVVDDDRSVREALKKLLEEEGWSVVLAGNGAEALDCFDSLQIDLLVLDLGLPVTSGWDAFERITNRDPALPIIVITGKPEQFDVAVAAGVGGFLEKPVDVSRLLEVIRELLAEPKEVRLQRLCGHRQDVRHVRPDSRAFLDHLRVQHESPFRCRKSPTAW